MKTKLLLLLFLLTGVATTNTINSQVTQSESDSQPKYVRILLHNGGMFEGEVIEIDESTFLINTPLMGHMRIVKTNIATIVYIDAEDVGLTQVNTRAGDVNPQASRYFFAPSGHQLKKGQGYYHNIWFGYNQISYGFSDNFTGGLTMTPLGTGGTVKLGYEINENLHASVGGIGVLPFGDEMGVGLMGIAFMNLTAGNERKNVTFSYGYGFFQDYVFVHEDEYTDSDGTFHPSDSSLGYGNYHYDNGEYHQMYSEENVWETQSVHMLCVSGMMELNSYMWLMTENYILLNDSFDDGYVSIMSVGIRKASARRDVLWDYAMVAIPSVGIAGIPFISVTVPF